MIHFFVDSGSMIIYITGVSSKKPCNYHPIKQLAPSQALNIGGGFPIRNSLGFNIIRCGRIVQILKKHVQACVSEPDIYTEFGKIRWVVQSFLKL